MENEPTMIDSDDRRGQTCTNCCAGYYTETSIYDDWDGLLHCTNKKCNHEVKRYKSKDNPEPKPEPQKDVVSAKAQAVLDAYENTIGYRQGFAAAIRELLEQVLPEHRPHHPLTLDERYRNVSASVIRDQVLAIVAQLEAL